MAREPHEEQRRRIRRSTMLWGGIALAIYLAYIIASLVRGWR